MNKSLSCSFLAHQTSTWMNGAQRRNTMAIQALILWLSGGGEHSSRSIVMRERKFSALRLVPLVSLSVGSWISKESKEFSDFLFTELTGSLIDYHKLTLVSQSYPRCCLVLNVVPQASIKLTCLNILLTKCCDSNSCWPSTKAGRVSDLRKPNERIDIRSWLWTWHRV